MQSKASRCSICTVSNLSAIAYKGHTMPVCCSGQSPKLFCRRQYFQSDGLPFVPLCIDCMLITKNRLACSSSFSQNSKLNSYSARAQGVSRILRISSSGLSRSTRKKFTTLPSKSFTVSKGLRDFCSNTEQAPQQGST